MRFTISVMIQHVRKIDRKWISLYDIIFYNERKTKNVCVVF